MADAEAETRAMATNINLDGERRGGHTGGRRGGGRGVTPGGGELLMLVKLVLMLVGYTCNGNRGCPCLQDKTVCGSTQGVALSFWPR